MMFPPAQKPDSKARFRNRSEFPEVCFVPLKKALDPVVTKDS